MQENLDYKQWIESDEIPLPTEEPWTVEDEIEEAYMDGRSEGYNQAWEERVNINGSEV